jgi:hypothetical protein
METTIANEPFVGRNISRSVFPRAGTTTSLPPIYIYWFPRKLLPKVASDWFPRTEKADSSMCANAFLAFVVKERPFFQIIVPVAVRTGIA